MAVSDGRSFTARHAGALAYSVCGRLHLDANSFGEQCKLAILFSRAAHFCFCFSLFVNRFFAMLMRTAICRSAGHEQTNRTNSKFAPLVLWAARFACACQPICSLSNPAIFFVPKLPLYLGTYNSRPLLSFCTTTDPLLLRYSLISYPLSPKYRFLKHHTLYLFRSNPIISQLSGKG